MKIFGKDYLLFLIIIGLNLILSSILFSVFHPISLSPQNYFFADLIEFNIRFPFWSYYLITSLNILLVWLIAKKFFLSRLSLIPPLIYSISPWTYYSTVFGSFQIFLVSLLLIAFLGILLIKNASRIGIILFILGSTMVLYSSLLLVIVYPIVILGLVWTKIIKFKMIKFPLILIAVICIPLLVSMYKNQIGVRNIYSNQINIFSDPGHINAINSFRGESKGSGFSILSKMSENKYIYFSQFLTLKSLKQLALSNFFTPQEKLMGFSLSSPIYIGFLIPYLYGLYLIIKSSLLRKYLIISLGLVLPSFLYRDLVNLNLLFIFEIVIIFIISFGLTKLLAGKKYIFKFFKFLIAFLVIIQVIINIQDIYFREYTRYERILGSKSEVIEQ